MNWLTAADLAVFRHINHDWAGPVLDVVMPFLSGNPFFIPSVVVLAAALLWRGGRRGRCFVAVLALTLAIGDPLVVGGLKRAWARPRPFVDHPETRLPGATGVGGSFSLPSGHAALWGAIATVSGIFYRRSRRWLVPLAAGVGLSRCYVGVHYPTDVLAGWGLGAAYGWILAHGLDGLWGRAGRRWFPLWWARLPSLLRPDEAAPPAGGPPLREVSPDAHWLHLGYALIAVMFVGRIWFVSSKAIELSEDEAYQWMWSKHLDWSYYSKPPLIAYAQWIGTHLCGDRELGVRLFPPLISAALSVLCLRFLARHTDARTAAWSVLVLAATPLLGIGSILMTIDPLTVFFWMVALFAGWRAITEDSTRWWLVVGVGWAGGFLSKYFSPFQIASFGVFFLLWPPARRQLRRPGPWLALLVNAVATLPVVWWNQRHGWVTATHLTERGGLNQPWEFKLRYLWDFLYSVPPLMNPVFFVAIVWAALACWRRPAAGPAAGPAGAGREPARDAMLYRYLFAMGGPVFLFYLAYTLRARVQPNWVCTTVAPLLLLGIVYWHRRWRAGSPWPGWLLRAGVGFGLPVVILLHDTNLVTKLTGHPIPFDYEPTKRVHGYREMGRLVGEQRALLAREGRPVIVIAHHYGFAGLLSFYLPEAKVAVGTPDPVVFVRIEEKPDNQLWFWPEYRYAQRKGVNALYVEEADSPTPPLADIRRLFDSVTEIGTFEALYRGRPYHLLRVFACRNLR